MQRSFIFRALTLCALAALAACSNTGGSTAAQTPAPSGTTMAQANSTAAPDQALTSGPGSKFFARTYALNGVQFEVWANGTPITTVQWPNKSVDITSKMRGHANNIAIRWTKIKKNGTGMLSITSAKGTKLMTAIVTASSPANAQITHTIIAPQAPSGNGLGTQ
ncbi:MAG: hypothetical protein ABR508_06445 [Candidatus Baltobacteraceae bacterium]